MAEGIWIGGHSTSDEERQQIENDYNARQSGQYQQTEDQGYYAGPMGEQAPEAPQPEAPAPAAVPDQGMPEAMPAEPQTANHYLADPVNFAEVWSKYEADPNYQDEHYSREQVNTLYDYYNYTNAGKPMEQWKPLTSDDPFAQEMIKKEWYDPQKEEAAQQAQQNQLNELQQIYNPTDPTKAAGFEQHEAGDWKNLDWIGKLFTAVSTNDTSLKNTPDWLDKTQAASQAMSSMMSGPAVLKIAGSLVGALGGTGAAAVMTNPYVLAGTALAVGGLTFYQALTGKEIPVFNKFLELSDIVDTTVEKAIGFGTQAYQMGKGYFQQAFADKNDSYGLLNAINDTIKEVGAQAGSMWNAGEYTYEMFGSTGDFAIDVLKGIFKGEEGTKEGEAWYFNRGENEKQQMAEGTYGYEGMKNIREMFEEMEELGIDKDTQRALMSEWANNTSGTSGFVSDYTAQMLLDADILMTPMESGTMGAISKITGDTNGVIASKNVSGNVLANVPVIGNVLQGVAGIKGPGGFFEWLDERRNLARTTDVTKLTKADRFFGGLDADGKIKAFARTENTGLADLLPESKVAGVGNIANNVMNAYMYDVQDTNDIRSRLSTLKGEADPNTAYRVEGLDNSAEVMTVRDGIRHAINETNPEIILKQFDDSKAARDTLANVATELGMDVKDVLSLYSETPAVFEQRVKDVAAKNNGMFAGLDVSTSVNPVTDIVQGFTTAKDGKGTPLDWDIRQVEYKITTSLIDSMAKYYTEYYGVKPNSTINTIFDTMKSAQSLLLLGWSPTYFINNVINNMVTSAAEGVLGFMTPGQINQYMTAFGVKPARMDVDTNAEFRGQTSKAKGGLEAFTSAASEAKKSDVDTNHLKKVLSEVNGVLRSANDKLGVFSRMSGVMETMQGNQLTAVAIQQYWGQRWKRGEGFHLMPTELVDAIERQTPGMSNLIYQAVENGMNMDQVGKTLFGTYIKPDAGTVMKNVCANLFSGESSVYEEVLKKSGVMNELNERMANCKTDAERQAVIDSVSKKVDDYIAKLRREDLIQRANNTAAVVEAEGLGPVSQMMSEMEMNHQDFWIRMRNEESDVMQKTANMDAREARALKAEVFDRHRQAFADLYKQEAVTAAGIMKGLGFQNESHAKYIGFMNENNQNWVDFNDAKAKELQRAFDRTSALREAQGTKVDRVQVNEVWEEYHRNVSELYDKHFEREMELSAKRDAAFIEGYEFATGKSGNQFRQNFDRIAEIRKQMHDMQQDAHTKTRDMTPEDKNKFYAEFNPKYNALIAEIGNLGDANAKIIDSSNNGRTYENHAEVKMTPEQTVTAMQTMETSNAIREQAMREQQGYLAREGIKQGWIDGGRSEAEAELMMQIFDATAESWAKQNGAYVDEYYSLAAQLKGIASWLPGAEDSSVLNQTAEEYAAKYHDIIMQHFGTPEFREWFGQSKVVDENNLPLVVHHGTNATITEFKKNMMGKNTGALSATMGFFFSGSSETAESYIRQPGTLFYQYAFNDSQAVPNPNLATDILHYSPEAITEFAREFDDISNKAWQTFDDDMGEGWLEAKEIVNAITDQSLSIEDRNQILTEAAREYNALYKALSHTEDIYSEGRVMDVYLSVQNPLVYDFEGAEFRAETYASIIARAKAEGHDGVILKNTYDGGPMDTIYVVFEPTQIKSIENDGTFNKLDPNILRQQAQQAAKGTFEHTDVGNIIRMLEASDVSTMVHESGHLFRRTLSTELLTEFTTWAGFDSVGEFQSLEARFWKNDPTLSVEDKARYEAAEEKFARGFEQYLADGSAPTPGLKAVFKAMRDYLLDIYQKVKRTVTGNDYSQQGEFQFNGETLNINAEINGVKLRDIFDRMLTDNTQRTPGYTDLINQRRTELSQNRKFMRLDPEALTKKAQYQVTDKIMKYFGSLQEAESALAHYTLPFTVDGMTVDDAVLHEVIQAVKADKVSDTPRLNQSVLTDDGHWSAEFAAMVDADKQKMFDDGVAIPFDQTDGVLIRGDVNTEYETMVQRWLRDFSNQKNLSAEQYLYAWEFFEWWVKGSDGEAPMGNLAWEAKVQKMVLDDFVTGENADIVKELKRRNTAGVEVDNARVPDKGEFYKRTYHFEHGYWDIAGNVYKDGKAVAYLPEQLSKMPKTIEVDGESYKVLGIDRKNPDGLVYYDPILEMTRTVIAGKPEGFDEPRNAYSFMRPAKQGSTPQTMPTADAYTELRNKYLMPALNGFMDEYKKADADARTKQMSGLDLQTRAQIAQWLDQDVSQDMRTEKYRAMKYSDSKKDAAMLNYNQRYGFDPLLTIISPYQFWYTRSMWKWAKRMIDKPALGNAYQRLKEYEERNVQENLPSRMAGKWRIPMAYLSGWMGGSVYMDLNSQLFPFSQFGESYGNNMNYAVLNARTEALLQEQVDLGNLTPEQMNEAIKSRKGAAWENAYAQAETEVGKSDQLSSLASQFISPSIFVTWAQKKKQGEDPGTLGSTRTGNAIKTLTKDIPLVSQLGGLIGDAMTMPEKALRKLYGFDYNEYGAYGDQQIRKQISQMCADGEITKEQALNAMTEKSGTIWDMAADRQQKEAMMKLPGFNGAEAAKQFVSGNASIGDALWAMGTSALGGATIYPRGEQLLREAAAARKQAYIDYANGDLDAVKRWREQYGDFYSTRQATYIDDPDELLKFTLYDHIQEIYYAQPYAQQQQIKKTLGPEFEHALFNPETKNYKAVDINKLAEWNAAIGGKNPYVGSIDVEGVEKVMQLSQPVIDVVELHDTEKAQKFPNINVIQDGYYSLPKDQRKAYLNQFPELSRYWEWNRTFKEQHEDYVRWADDRSDYFNEVTCYESFAGMSQRTMQELEYARATGKQMSNTAQYELQSLYKKYADPNYTSYEDYIKLLQNYK